MELANHDNQDIANGASKLLQSSSTVTNSDLGSNLRTTSPMGEGEEYTYGKWYYMFLRNRELKFYITLFKKEYHFKIFSYTTAQHKQRFDKCSFSKEDYKERRDAAEAVRQAFQTGSVDRLNALTKEDEIKGDGYLFVCAPKEKLNEILKELEPRQYLITRYKSYEAASISNHEMEEFIYLYESMPYNIEVMEHSIEDYINKKQKVRITAGPFEGKVGCIVRMHRNSKLVFQFGGMCVGISYMGAFVFERVEE